MIFSGNTTALGATTIPMAEGYDCSYGVPLALVEAARNDMAMFKALVQSDYREMAICKESAGVVMEGELSALHEAVGGGIFKKIAELFRKLVAKVKSIFHNLMAKFRALYMKDKDLVKKYSKELVKKRNLDKLEVKWRKFNESNFDSIMDKADPSFDEHNGWNSESWEREKYYFDKIAKLNVDSATEFAEELFNTCFDDEDTVTLKEIGGWREMAMILEDQKALKDMNKFVTDTEKKLKNIVSEYEKKANEAGKASLADKENEEKTTASETANHAHDMAVAYQSAVLTTVGVIQKMMVTHYKYAKAAFMKAVTANEKKLEESAIYAEAVAEAAAEEVDSVINSALSGEEISDLSAASTNVKDSDVSDDPDKLTYGPDCYTKSVSMDDAEGSIDSCIGGGKVEESTYFGKMFY